MKHLNAAILAALSILIVSSQAIAAASPEPVQAEFVLSEEEFPKQRAFMLEDLAQKIKLLQTAYSCAEKATTSVGFSMCTNALQDGIRAAMSKMSKKPPEGEKKQ